MSFVQVHTLTKLPACGLCPCRPAEIHMIPALGVPACLKAVPSALQDPTTLSASSQWLTGECPPTPHPLCSTPSSAQVLPTWGLQCFTTLRTTATLVRCMHTAVVLCQPLNRIVASFCADLFRCGAVHCEADVPCCADTWYTNGTVSSPDSGFEGLTSGGGQSRMVFAMIAMQLCSHVTTCCLLPAGTWQPVWDSWQVRCSNPLPRWKCLS